MSAPINTCVRRNLVFVHGKGGVGKSSIAQALASGLAGKQGRILLTEFENPTRPAGEARQLGSDLWDLNADAMLAFEEYAGLKIEKVFGGLGSFGTSGLTKIFTQNKLIKYLAKAAPGVHELVLLGKVWHERNHYDHVIVDLPSTGYGLAMFQSAVNFSSVFRGGPLSHDAEDMLRTFRDPEQTGHLIVALPEEMPLRESLELDGYLKELFPANSAAFLVNRRFPKEDHRPVPIDESPSPYATSVADYISRRIQLETQNLKLWTNAGIQYGELDLLPPTETPKLIQNLCAQMKERGLI